LSNKATGSYVNGKKAGRNQIIMLTEGDKITLGDMINEKIKVSSKF